MRLDHDELVRLYSGGGFGGKVLAISAPVTFTYTPLQTTEFDFAAPATFTLGTMCAVGTELILRRRRAVRV